MCVNSCNVYEKIQGSVGSYVSLVSSNFSNQDFQTLPKEEFYMPPPPPPSPPIFGHKSIFGDEVGVHIWAHGSDKGPISIALLY